MPFLRLMEIQLQDYDLISFDIFDTLLLRAVARPSDIFCRQWRKALEAEPRASALSPEEFRRLRIEAERRARARKTSREVSLQDIYREIPSFIYPDKQRLMDLELDCEAEYCYRNPEILALAEKAASGGVKLALLSDMYLGQGQLKDLLKACGIPLSLFGSITVSCEAGCSKQDGRLYQELLRLYPSVPPERILHIGDSLGGDYRQAIAAGIHACHYDVIPDRVGSIYDYERMRHDSPLPGILSLRKLAARGDWAESAEDGRRHIGTACELGAAVAGPFLSLFAAYVIGRLQQLDIHRIYPFMREGALLGTLLEREAAGRGFPLVVRPVYISRKVTYVPSLSKIGREELEDMIGARNLTVSEALRLMGLSPEDFPDLQGYYGLSLKEGHLHRIGNQTVRERLLQDMLEPARIQEMESYIKAERRKLISYLQQEIGDFDDIATIDVGFFGRTQMWMERCLTLEGIPFRMKHFLAIGLTGGKVCGGIDYEGYYSTFAESPDLVSVIHRTTDILEKMVSVPEGSTVGYRDAGGRIEPIQEEALPNGAFYGAVSSGVLRFQELWLAFCKDRPEIASACLADRREGLMLLHRLIDMPRPEEAELFRTVKADTNFGTGYVESIIADRDLVLLEEKGIDFIDKCNASYTYEGSRVVWPKGVVTLRDPSYYIRRVLESNAGSDILRSMLDVTRQAQAGGAGKVALYGAGENGRQFLSICRLCRLPVSCFVDRKESLWGTCREGIPVMGIGEALERGESDFIITSLFSISEIRAAIAQAAGNGVERLHIYSV